MASVQFVTDSKGQRTAVIVPLEEFEAMVANFERFVEEVDDPDLTVAMKESENSPRVPLERVLEALRNEN